MKILAKWKDLTVKLDSPEEEKAFDYIFSRLKAAKDPSLLISLSLVESGQFIPNLEHIIGKQLIVTGLIGSGKITGRKIKEKKVKPLSRRHSKRPLGGLLNSNQPFLKS